ncbi:MAG: hypothetical protein WD341_02760 [Tistlia sp.]|uniref:hypothetical protein n=1 Tax=Tistlia sp. TaxID=3057121 RepID=UPI0034A54284
MPQPLRHLDYSDRLAAATYGGGTSDLAAQPAWSGRRTAATVALLSLGSWAGVGLLALAAVKLAEWEAEAGLLRFLLAA